ncbi:MAG TPA: hypothetical protein VFN28_03430, partial [Amaricoccus sp.]|nr:hypothetical protein [Amaricoccus sp.]
MLVEPRRRPVGAISASEKRMGLAAPREPPSSHTIPRATACGSAKASATVLMGPAGTPARSIAASTSARAIPASRDRPASGRSRGRRAPAP